MKKILFFLCIAAGLLSCSFPTSFPTELPLLEAVKPADKFSRAFIDKIIAGQVESAFADVEPEVLNDHAKEFITNASRNISGAELKKYSIVEETGRTLLDTKAGKSTTYQLGYEYEFLKGKNILFTTTIKEKDGKLSVLAFDGQVLQVPLTELNKFSLEGKPFIDYLFLALSIMVPLFILTTGFLMLRSKIIVRKKIIWAFLILFLSTPTFIVNWNSGAIDFKLLNFTLLGAGAGRPSLYSPWFLSFAVPIGAILYWLRRENLLREFEQQSEEYNRSIDQ